MHQICGFLLDDNDDKVLSSKIKSIEKVMTSQQDQMRQTIAFSMDNSDSVSAIKSNLTDLIKAVNGLKKVTFRHNDGLYLLNTKFQQQLNNCRHN